MADKLSDLWAHFLHHAPDDMLTVFAVGLGVAAVAIAVLRLVSTTRGDRVWVRRQKDGMFSVRDNTTDKPAEEAAGGLRYVNLRLGEAIDYERNLNRDRAKKSN